MEDYRNLFRYILFPLCRPFVAVEIYTEGTIDLYRHQALSGCLKIKEGTSSYGLVVTFISSEDCLCRPETLSNDINLVINSCWSLAGYSVAIGIEHCVLPARNR